MCELADQMGFIKEMRRRRHSTLQVSDKINFHVNVWKDGSITWSVIDEVGKVVERGKENTLDDTWNRYLKIKN